MPWLLNIAYCLLIAAVSPVLLYRVIALGKYREGWSEKLLGRVPVLPKGRERVWLHAVSVGEVVQLQPVITRLRARCPDLDVVITTTTPTGRDVARSKYPDHTVCYFPLDFTWAVKNALDRIQPSLIVLVELELWPNFVFEATRRGIPLGLINGRITEHSFRGYRKVRPLISRLLQRLQFIAMQNDQYAQRMLDLGAPPERVQITGSIKFDGVQTDRQNAKTNELRQSFGLAPDELVVIAGSTQAPEEEFALDAYESLRRQHKNLRLIIVPRHKERFEEVAQLIERRLPLLRRSRLRNSPGAFGTAGQPDQPAVLLLDTLGELAACWGLADVAYVGGSLTNRGGQNMIEPAGYGAAVLFGPNTHNFRDAVDLLLAHSGARVVHDREEMFQATAELLGNVQLRNQMGSAAQQLVLAQQGATDSTVELIAEALKPGIGRVGRVIGEAA